MSDSRKKPAREALLPIGQRAREYRPAQPPLSPARPRTPSARPRARRGTARRATRARERRRNDATRPARPRSSVYPDGSSMTMRRGDESRLRAIMSLRTSPGLSCSPSNTRSGGDSSRAAMESTRPRSAVGSARSSTSNARTSSSGTSCGKYATPSSNVTRRSKAWSKVDFPAPFLPTSPTRSSLPRYSSG